MNNINYEFTSLVIDSLEDIFIIIDCSYRKNIIDKKLEFFFNEKLNILFNYVIMDRKLFYSIYTHNSFKNRQFNTTDINYLNCIFATDILEEIYLVLEELRWTGNNKKLSYLILEKLDHISSYLTSDRMTFTSKYIAIE